MDNTSASEYIHKLLMPNGEGFKFTLFSLQKMIKAAGFEFTEGAVSGFINRAIRAGAVDYVGKVQHPESNRKVYEYVILSTEPWKFKSKSQGSQKGRVVNRAPNADVPDLSEVVPVEDKPLSLSDKLYNLALEALEIENKSLGDYSTEELLNEVKKRMK